MTILLVWIWFFTFDDIWRGRSSLRFIVDWLLDNDDNVLIVFVVNIFLDWVVKVLWIALWDLTFVFFSSFNLDTISFFGSITFDWIVRCANEGEIDLSLFDDKGLFLAFGVIFVLLIGVVFCFCSHLLTESFTNLTLSFNCWIDSFRLSFSFFCFFSLSSLFIFFFFLCKVIVGVNALCVITAFLTVLVIAGDEVSIVICFFGLTLLFFWTIPFSFDTDVYNLIWL